MRTRPTFSTLDRYLLLQVGRTMASVFAIIISLMTLEHFPRLLEIVSLSGRKTYIVIQSVLALIPEYAGLALLFGLYLAIALTIRRLSLRGELDIVQATGISMFRSMRFPALLALVVAGLTLWNQGWLIPMGEQHLRDLGQRMENGQFGYNLEAGKFTDFGKGVTLRFSGVDPYTHELRVVFFRTADTIVTASRGRLGFDFSKHVLIDLHDGRALNSSNGQSLSFKSFHFDSGEHNSGDDERVDLAERRKTATMPVLLASRDSEDNAVAYSRLLWPVFTLLVPFLAATLGKPRRRSSTALGVMLGVVILVMFIRSTGFIASTGSTRPALTALGIMVAWIAAVSTIVWGERRWGAGYVDTWLMKTVRLLKLDKLRARNGRFAANSV